MTDLPAPPATPDDGAPDGDDTLRRRLRTDARAARRAVTGAARAERTAAAAERLLWLLDLVAPDDRGLAVVAVSVPDDGELDMTGAADELRRRGWTVCLPVVGDGVSMTFREWDPDAPLTPNRFGIPEPASGATVRPDVVVVPCVAVDADGNRLGFGKGFYDRALAVDRPWAVGVVLDEQVVDRVPAAAWDVPLDAVVTPTRTLRPGRAPADPA